MSTPQNKNKDMQAHTGSTPAPAAGGASRSASSTGTASASKSQSILSLPSGGGALRGIGEKFATNPATGTSTLSIPLPLSPARGARPSDPDNGQEATLGFAPELSLAYDSGSGNGLFGLGWSVAIPSISRKTDKGLPRYEDTDESDVFLLSGAEDLVPLTDSNGHVIVANVDGFKVRTYRPRTEGLYARIQRFDQNERPVFWRTISKDNVTSYFKDTVQYGADDKRIFSWLLSYSYDDKGNAIEYAYLKDAPATQDRSSLSDAGRDILAYTSQPALHRVYYGNRHPYSGDGSRPSEATDSSWLFELAFDFGENEDALGLEAGTPWTMRPDAFSNYRAGFELRTWQLCRRVLLYHHFTDTNQSGHTNYEGVVKALCFEYDRRPEGTRLTAVQPKGYSQSDDNYIEQSMPAVRFTYTAGTISERLRTLTPDSLKNLPQGVNGSNYQFADLFGEGSPGILTEQAGGWYYKRNLSAATLEKHGSFLLPEEARFSSTRILSDRPAAGLSQGGQLTDLDGDGRQELVHFGGESPGFYTARNEDEFWDTFLPFESLPTVDFAAQGLRFVDLTGDGRADILLIENEVFKVFESLGRQGYGASRTLMQGTDDAIAPTVTYSDDHQGIFLADMCGDGLSDIVRVRNGSISYWPNLGYGVFGRRIDMANAPKLAADGLFDPKRIRLGDVDGSGPSDLIYLGVDGVCLYRNQSGSAWSDGGPLPVFPSADSLSTVMLADLHGAGTQCLVWSTPLPNQTNEPLRYLELFAEGKPNLLASIDNGMGAVTRITYAPSTHFYQRDMADGKPWATRLHFPVQVVENVETLDLVARNRFVTRYAYHHGFFDGEEREFRGFGMVEQWDSESFASFSSTGDSWSWDHSENWNTATHVPPVHTKTWFHTGAFLEARRLEEAYASEYFREPGLTDEQSACLHLPTSLLDAGVTDPTEHREALRTLRGKPLRVEIYADDDTDKAPYPYQVTESTYQVRRIQEKRKQRHGVFSAHPWQTLELHYERENLETNSNPDPRTVQSMTLELDDFGNELKKLVIQHPRRTQALPAVLPADTADQWYAKSLLQPRFLYTEQLFTDALNGDSIWRAPLPYHTRSYQLYRLRQKRAQDLGTTEPAIAFPKPLEEAAYRVVDGDLLFRFDTAQEAIDAALASTLVFDDEFGLADVSKANIPAARLLSELVIQYWKSLENGQPAEYSQAGVPALVYTQFQLAFDEPLMTRIMNDTDFSAGNGYQLVSERGGFLPWNNLTIEGFSAAENTWWKPSPSMYYKVGGDFFQSFAVKDAFGNHTSTDWDFYRLLPTTVTDARDNRTSALYDYRTLHPSAVTDPNDCVQLAYYDSLGRLTATVVKGNAWSPTGDFFTVQSDISEGDVADLLTDLTAGNTTVAETLLGSATCRYIYDANRFSRSSGKEPAIAVSIQREQHVNTGGTALQCSIGYSDGMGRAIQSKMRAGAGVALGSQSPKAFVDTVLAGTLMPVEVLTTAHEHGFLGNPAYEYATMLADGDGKIDADALNEIFRLAALESAPDSYLRPVAPFLSALREASLIDSGYFRDFMYSVSRYGVLDGNRAGSLLAILKDHDIPKSEDHDTLAALVSRVGGLSRGALSYLISRCVSTESGIKGDRVADISRQLADQTISSMSPLDIVRIAAYFIQVQSYLSAEDFEKFSLLGPDGAVIPTLLEMVSITPTQASDLLALADAEGWASVNVAKALFVLLLTHGKITASDKSELDTLADSYGFFRQQVLDALMPKILTQDPSLANAYGKRLLELSGSSLSADIYQSLLETFEAGEVLPGAIGLAGELLQYKSANVISFFSLLSDEPLYVDMSSSTDGLVNLILALYRKNVLTLWQAFSLLNQIPIKGYYDADILGEIIGSLAAHLTDTSSSVTLTSLQTHILYSGVDESVYTALRALLLEKLPDSVSLVSDPPPPPVTLSKLWLDAILASFRNAGLLPSESYEAMAYTIYKYPVEVWQFHLVDDVLSTTISDTALTNLRDDIKDSGLISDAQLV
ncbi:SpvB/TcaC N-terminal domain-containing protein, partial [Nostoc sp. NIES-2111]